MTRHPAGLSSYGSSDFERQLSFVRPKRIPTAERLARLIAIDGNDAVCVVSPQEDAGFVFSDFDQPGTWASRATLPEALLAAEQGLVKFLRLYDYEVEFV